MILGNAQYPLLNRSNLFVAATVLLLAIAAAALALSGKILIGFGAVTGVALIVLLTRMPRYGLIALIFTSTSLLVPTGAYMTGLPLSLSRLLGISVSIGFAVWAYNRRFALTYAPQMKWLFTFLGIVLLSTIIMPDKQESLSGLIKILQACLLYFLIANLSADPKWLRVFCIAITGTAILASLIAAIEHYLPSLHLAANDPRLQQGVVGAIVDDESAESGDIARVSGGIGDANYLAYTLAAAMPLCLYWWRRARTNLFRALIIAAVILQLIGMAFSYTRTGFLGLGVATLFLLIKQKLPLGPLLLVGLLAATVAAFWLPPTFAERMFSTRYLKEGSTPVRKDLVYTGWKLFEARPILGYGYGQFGPEFIRKLRAGLTLHELKGGSGQVMEEMIDKGYEAVNDLRCHNTYLEVAIEYGLVGLFPYLLFLIYILRDLRITERIAEPEYGDLAVCLSASIIAFMTCGMLGHAKVLNIFWILAGLALALRRVVMTESTQRAKLLETRP